MSTKVRKIYEHVAKQRFTLMSLLNVRSSKSQVGQWSLYMYMFN